MQCSKILSNGYQLTIKIKRNRIRMEKLEKTENLGLGDRKRLKTTFRAALRELKTKFSLYKNAPISLKLE